MGVTAEDMFELLKRKDAEIAAYKELVDALRRHFAQASSEYEAESAYQRAYRELDSVFYEYGFKSDGGWRGIS